MTTAIDIRLTRDQRGLFDMTIGADGDFTQTPGMDTSLVMSLGVDARADGSEVAAPERRRGWWGNELDATGFEIGSKLWLLDQARKTQTTANRGRDYAKKALEWLVTDGYADDVVVSPSFISDGIALSIDIHRANSVTESLAYELWEHTNGV